MCVEYSIIPRVVAAFCGGGRKNFVCRKCLTSHQSLSFIDGWHECPPYEKRYSECSVVSGEDVVHLFDHMDGIVFYRCEMLQTGAMWQLVLSAQFVMI